MYDVVCADTFSHFLNANKRVQCPIGTCCFVKYNLNVLLKF